MNPMLQTMATLVAVSIAAVYLGRSAWRSFARAARARRPADRERLCDPDCGCGH